jgi:hypothetical protein
MTPKMEAALEAAELAGDEGLHWTRAGWHAPQDDRWTFHGPVIVSRLVHDRGFLAEAGKPGRSEASRRVITAKGKEYLQDKRRTA